MKIYQVILQSDHSSLDAILETIRNTSFSHIITSLLLFGRNVNSKQNMVLFRLKNKV